MAHCVTNWFYETKVNLVLQISSPSSLKKSYFYCIQKRNSRLMLSEMVIKTIVEIMVFLRKTIRGYEGRYSTDELLLKDSILLVDRLNGLQNFDRQSAFVGKIQQTPEWYMKIVYVKAKLHPTKPLLALVKRNCTTRIQISIVFIFAFFFAFHLFIYILMESFSNPTRNHLSDNKR